MKNILVSIIGLSLLFYCMRGSCNGTTDDQTEVKPNTSAENTLKILSSSELNDLATNWATEYCRLNPSIKIAISNVPDNQSIATNNIYFISDKNAGIINDGTKWEMVIGSDAVVPVINAKNPMLDEIYRQGISPEKFAQLFSNPEMSNWKRLINNGQNAPIHYFIIDNESVKTSIADFSNINPSMFNGNIAATADEIISAVEKDIYAIGFCKLTDVRNTTTNEIIETIKLLPIDKNKNGRIDNFEKIYDQLSAFTRGVWIGKYPHALCGSIYAVSASKPTDPNALAFLTWVLADGQQFLNKNGYSDLTSSKIQSNLSALADTGSTIDQPQNASTSKGWLIVLIAFVVLTSAMIIAFMYLRNKKSIVHDEDINFTPAFDENSILAPKGIYFDKTHTWAFMEKDGFVRVGIDDFLQHITGTLTRVKLKEPGEKVRKGEKILTIIRNGKQLDIYTPISGTIKEQNQRLIADSSILNSSPFLDGWVYMIEPKNWLREIQFLFMSENYNEWLKDEFTRLKDFFTATVRSNTLAYSHIILQDGGELTDNVLADLEPEVWEDFQTKFIDTSK